MKELSKIYLINGCFKSICNKIDMKSCAKFKMLQVS
jgi:hypothetical protein